MSLRQAKQIAKTLISNSKPIIFLLLFSYMVALIPEKLEVKHLDFSQTDQVKAAYEQLLIESTKQNTQDSIAFDTMMVDISNGEAVITYKVAPGDTLAKIAKNFGTTTAQLAKTNDLENANRLRTGQLLVISYEDGVPYEIQKPTTAREFALAYDLNLNDFLTVNYFSEGEMQLEEGRQVILPLNEREAQKKGLIPKEEFVMLDLEEERKEVAFVPEQETKQLVQDESHTPGTDTGYVQTVITADETEKNLEKLQNNNEPSKNQENNKLPETEKITEPSVEEQKNPCTEGQCYFRNECRTKPENAHCVPEDTDNAWLCNEGYKESRKSCVKLPDPVPVVEEKPQEAPESLLANTREVIDEAIIPENSPRESNQQTAGSDVGEILEQRYTNYAAQEDYAYNGFGAGHCTEAADYYFQKNHGIDARALRKGGNAYQRPSRARNAGLVVNTTPAVGAVAYTNISGYRSRYGHLVYVTKVNQKEGTLEVIDQNYVGRHITTRRIISMDDVIEYIHPRFQ